MLYSSNPFSSDKPKLSLSLLTNNTGIPDCVKLLYASCCISVIITTNKTGITKSIAIPVLSTISSLHSFMQVANSRYINLLFFFRLVLKILLLNLHNLLFSLVLEENLTEAIVLYQLFQLYYKTILLDLNYAMYK